MRKSNKETRRINFLALLSRNNSWNKAFVLFSNWDPRNPDRWLLPDSVIAEFRRRRNLGELIGPTKHRRQPRLSPTPVHVGGCMPCGAKICKIHTQLVTSNLSISPWLKTEGCTHNMVYYLKCIKYPGLVVWHKETKRKRLQILQTLVTTILMTFLV